MRWIWKYFTTDNRRSRRPVECVISTTPGVNRFLSLKSAQRKYDAYKASLFQILICYFIADIYTIFKSSLNKQRTLSFKIKKDSLNTVFFYKKETNGLSLFFSFITIASILFSDFICNCTFAPFGNCSNIL